jgi:hypothetical protein
MPDHLDYEKGEFFIIVQKLRLLIHKSLPGRFSALNGRLANQYEPNLQLCSWIDKYL